MIRPEIRVLLIGPDGVEDDITERVEMSDIGTLTEEIEDDLIQLTHSDVDLDVDDHDGWVSVRLGMAQRGEVWQLVIERETGSRRPKWTRVFAGVLDVPGSIQIDIAERSVSVHAWSYSKLLEFYSAAPLARSATNLTGTATSGTATVTVSPDTSDLRAGDKITLKASSSETKTITIVNSASEVTVDSTWSSSYSGAALTLDTPYPRGESAEDLARALFALAGIDETTVDIGQILSGTLFPTSMSASGLPGGVPDAILEFGGKLLLYLGGKRYEATDAASGWSDMGADTVKLDWQPYLPTEPAALQQGTRTKIYDYVDAAHPYYELVLADSGATRYLRLKKNGATLVDVESVDTTSPEPAGAFPFYAYEVAAYWSEIWVSYRKTTKTRVRTWDPDVEEFYYVERTQNTNRTKRYSTAGVLLSTMDGAGPMRFVRTDDRIAWYKTHKGGGRDDAEAIPAAAIVFMNKGTAAGTLAAGGVDMWTFRKVGTEFYAGVNAGNVKVWSASSHDLLADYPLVATPTGNPAACVFAKGGTIDAQFDGWTASMYFTVAKSSSNVVPYADFEGLSCGAAMRELAIVAMAHFFVDQYRVGHLVGRASSWVTGREATDLDDPLEQKVRPVWDNLRRSVRVSGTAEDGTKIEVTVGEAGDSASRLEVSPKIPMTAALAGILAAAYAAQVGAERQQSDETIEEPPGGPVRVLDRVVRDGRTWLVQRAELDLRDLEQDLVLVEEVD